MQDCPPMFVLAVIDRQQELATTLRKTIARSSRPIAPIELELGGAIVRIASGGTEQLLPPSSMP